MKTRVSRQSSLMRRTPRQQRSRVLVDAIIDAATRVLSDRGWADFTTNEVASVAGVSVGSLYQYFADKLELVEMIRQRHLDALLAALSNSTQAHPLATLDDRVTQLIDGVVAVHSVNRALHRILLEEVPLVPRRDHDAFEQRYQNLYRVVVETSTEHRDTARDDVAAQVLSAAVEGVVHAAARSGQLDSPALKSELVHLVCGFLRARNENGDAGTTQDGAAVMPSRSQAPAK